MRMDDSILEKLHTIFGAAKVLTREGLNLRVAYSVTLLAEAQRTQIITMFRMDFILCIMNILVKQCVTNQK